MAEANQRSSCTAIESSGFLLRIGVSAPTRIRPITLGLKVKNCQTNGIRKRFHKTMLNEFYRVVFHIKIYSTCDELQADLDAWLNFTKSNDRIRVDSAMEKLRCKGFLTAFPLTKEKMIVA